MSQTPSISKNSPCECGSKLKAKHCCMTKKKCQPIPPSMYQTGQPTSSEHVRDCIELLQDTFPNHIIIDITNKLNNSTYKPFQLANYTDPVIMVAEKTASNAEVFATRVDSAKSDMMVMYHGCFRTFSHKYLERVFNSVCAIIR